MDDRFSKSGQNTPDTEPSFGADPLEHVCFTNRVGAEPLSTAPASNSASYKLRLRREAFAKVSNHVAALLGRANAEGKVVAILARS